MARLAPISGIGAVSIVVFEVGITKAFVLSVNELVHVFFFIN